MSIFEKQLSIPAAPGHKDILPYIEKKLKEELKGVGTPIRFSIGQMTKDEYLCEVGISSDEKFCGHQSIFSYVPRGLENTDQFNIALVIPTGIGAELGGHAGDGGSLAKFLGSMCDNLITHPNVVNASDINDMSDNTLYVEGSIMSRLLMGTIGLHKVRSNRVLVVIDDHQEKMFSNAAINAVSAARACFGFDCPKVIKLDPPVKLKSHFTEMGSAAGEIENLDYLFEVLEECEGQYDAVAISSVIDVPFEYHQGYFDAQGEMVNPWGGVEAMLTHSISERFSVPSAHSPMFEDHDVSEMDPGIVDPRMAAEAVSVTFLNCLFKGLQKSPRIVHDKQEFHNPSVLSASDVSCLIIPDGCVGVPVLAALEQGVKVIAVRGNKNIMQANNSLEDLPWAEGQLHIVENYLEVAGVIAAMKAGLTAESVSRPMEDTKIEIWREGKDVQDTSVASEAVQLEDGKNTSNIC